MLPVEKDSMLMYKEKLLTQKDKDELEAARVALLNPAKEETAKSDAPKSEIPQVADSDKRTDRRTEKRADKTSDKESGVLDRFFK